jgi:hypothetical protein
MYKRDPCLLEQLQCTTVARGPERRGTREEWVEVHALCKCMSGQ